MYVLTRRLILPLLYPSAWISRVVIPRTLCIASNPPPRDLKVSDPTVRDLTLGELGLAPSSILHFRFVDDGLNRACPFLSGSPVPLSPVEEVAALSCPVPPEKFRSGLIFRSFETSPGSDLPAPLASVVLEHAVDLPAPSDFDGNQKKEEAPPPSTVSASSSNRARDTAGEDVKIPKWLKLGSSEFLSMRRLPCLHCNFSSLLRKKVTPHTRML